MVQIRVVKFKDIGSQARDLRTGKFAPYRLSQYIPCSEWTPICAFNFKAQQQACEDLGFSGFIGFNETHSDSINDGKWEISDGWRGDYAYGKYPNTELGSKLINEKPKRNIFHISNTPINYRL